MRQDKVPNLIWFLAGVVLGGAVGVMISPQPGAETRRMLSRRAREASGYVTTHGHDYLEYGRDLYDKGRQLADEAANMFEEGRRLVEDASAAEAGA